MPSSSVQCVVNLRLFGCAPSTGIQLFRVLPFAWLSKWLSNLLVNECSPERAGPCLCRTHTTGTGLTRQAEGAKFPTIILYAIAGASSVLPDAIAFNFGFRKILSTQVLSGLAHANDLLLGIYNYGAVFDFVLLTQTGSLTLNPPGSAKYPDQGVGLWPGYLTISGTSAGAQGATFPDDIDLVRGSNCYSVVTPQRIHNVRNLNGLSL